MLEAWFDAVGDRVLIHVDVAAAIGPIVIDPLIYLETASVLSADGAASDYFGAAVALSNDTAVVGAHLHDSLGDTNRGAAYVFVRQVNGSWAEQAKLVAVDGAASDQFGASVAIDGDVVVVGAPFDDPQNTDEGSAYVFTRTTPTNWVLDSKLTGSDSTSGANFGNAVAVSGDTILVGARKQTVGAAAEQGAAYVFVRQSDGSWGPQAKLVAGDGAARDQFGCSVALSGNRALIGACRDDIGASADQGSAYVFEGTDGWAQPQKLTALDGAAGDNFGCSVSLDGNTAVIGAFGDDVGGVTDSGSAHVFVNMGSDSWIAWIAAATLTASDGAAGDWFGSSVAVSSGTILVGAFGDDGPDGMNEGSAYLFDGADWSSETPITPSGTTANSYAGWVVALSGAHTAFGAHWHRARDASTSAWRSSHQLSTSSQPRESRAHH